MKRFDRPAVKAFVITFVILMVVALPITLAVSAGQRSKEENQQESISTTNVETAQTPTSAQDSQDQVGEEMGQNNTNATSNNVTETPVPTATPKPLSLFQATAFSSKRSAYFPMRPITNPDYLITRNLFIAEKTAEQQKNKQPATNATSIYVYIPEATGFQSARVDEAASKQQVDIRLVDAEGNDATGNSEFLAEGGAIVISNMQVGVMYQISVTTDMGTYGAVIQPKE